MLKEYKTKTNVFIGVGLILQIVGLTGAGLLGDTVMLQLIRVVAGVLFITGCVYYSKGKGHSGAWGALGLLSLIGLIILVCMTDRNK